MVKPLDVHVTPLNSKIFQQPFVSVILMSKVCITVDLILKLQILNLSFILKKKAKCIKPLPVHICHKRLQGRKKVYYECVGKSSFCTYSSTMFHQ